MYVCWSGGPEIAGTSHHEAVSGWECGVWGGYAWGLVGAWNRHTCNGVYVLDMVMIIITVTKAILDNVLSKRLDLTNSR